LEVWFTGAKTG
jgi:hypothetical protein